MCDYKDLNLEIYKFATSTLRFSPRPIFYQHLRRKVGIVKWDFHITNHAPILVFTSNCVVKWMPHDGPKDRGLPQFLPIPHGLGDR